MLMLTEGAAEAIKVLAETPGAEGLRISTASVAETEGDSGLQIGLVEGPGNEDAVLDAGGAQVFLAPDTVEPLSDKVLDAELDGQNVRFALLEQEADAEPGPSQDGPIA